MLHLYCFIILYALSHLAAYLSQDLGQHHLLGEALKAARMRLIV